MPQVLQNQMPLWGWTQQIKSGELVDPGKKLAIA
jgi:hypothetical protein